MRTLWNVISFLAVVHLLALVGFVGWLKSSDRLNMDRVEAMRAMFAPTITEAATSEAEAAAEAEAAEAETAAQEREDNPPVSSGAVLASSSESRDQEEQYLRSVEDMVRTQRSALERERAVLASREAAFEEKMAAWESDNMADVDAARAAQFERAVKLLSTLPPRNASDMIRSMVEEGRREIAVRSLDQMPQRTAAKILAQFKDADGVKLASELLNDIRLLGTGSAAGSSPAES